MKKIRKQKSLYYLTYTAVFILMCLILFSYYYLNHRTFINHTNDGLVQHYKALTYYSEYLRTIFRSIFIEHRFVIPQWDFSIGEGSDILQTLHMYAIGDPLSFFAVFFPKDRIYIWYDLSILIRLYLSGIVFSALCFYTGQEDSYSVLAGSLVYVFCYWSLLNVNEHIYFLNPMIYLPLIVLGVEKIIREDKPVLLTVAVFISAISNFYFFYMLVILTVIYVAVRLLFAYGTDFGSIVKKLIRIFVFSLLATLMASVILLPVIQTFVSDSRISLSSSNHFLYPRFYYERFFVAYVSNDLQYDLCLGFASPTLLFIGLMMKDRGKSARMLLTFGFIALLMICLPFAGKMMNGFAYPINRWSFAVALIVAYITVYEWNSLEENHRYVLIWMGLVFCVSMVSAWSRQLRVLVAYALCVLFYIVSVFFRKKGNLKQILLILIIILNIAFIADCDYSSRGSERILDAADQDEAINEILYSDAERLSEYLDKANQNTLSRYSGNYLQINAAMLAKTYSTDFYWSLSNTNVISYREKLGLLDYTSYLYRGFDDRAALYTLANVRYFVANDDIVPYGFDSSENMNGIEVYENSYALPFGYTYENSISYETWNQLDQIGKQAALLDHIVTEDGKDLSLNYDFRLDHTLEGEEGIAVEGDQIICEKEKAVLHIRFNNAGKGEYCLSLAGLEFEDTEGYIEGNRTWVRIRSSAGDVEKSIHYLPREYQFYSGRHDFTVCFGYPESGLNEITLTLPYPGIYHFDDLYVTCNDYADYRNSVDALKADVLKDVVISDNKVNGRITVDQEKYLLLSIPYAKGWKATVNGEKAKLIRANECYMALKLEKGTYNIELNYHTPLLKAGVLLSVVSTFVFVLYIIKTRKTEK